MADNLLLEVYYLLLKRYGEQGWWPISGIYKKRKRLNEKQILEVCIGAILAQNTSWGNAAKALENIKKKNLFDISLLNNIDKRELSYIIKSSGFYKQKAKTIKNLIRFLSKNSIFSLRKQSRLELRNNLLKINGIGKETADSILLYAFNKPMFVVDAYTKRIFSRIGICNDDVSYDYLQKYFHRYISKSAVIFNEFHALIVKHAKEHCRKVPICEGCIISRICKYRKS